MYYGTILAPTGTRAESPHGPTLRDMYALLRKVGADDDGTLPAYAWPGGYPVAYLDRAGDLLCSDCANAYMDAVSEDPERVPVDGDVLWEGPDEACAECGAIIPTAYGDPDSDA